MSSQPHRLFELDHPIYGHLVRLIWQYRFMTTGQIARFTKIGYLSQRSALRQTNRHLKLLSEHGLVTSLERRVGGWQGGSAMSIWTLTDTGQQVITGRKKRKRPEYLSTHFLEHHLAITEVHLVATETARSQSGIIISEMELEPACWRSYLGPHGEQKTLKPDMFLQITSPQYVDSYYIEVDRATENPARVIRKTMQYQDWQQRGTDQETLGVFPKILWLTPNQTRQEQLTRHLKADKDIRDDIFSVITLEELPQVIIQGPGH